MAKSMTKSNKFRKQGGQKDIVIVGIIVDVIIVAVIAVVIDGALNRIFFE